MNSLRTKKAAGLICGLLLAAGLVMGGCKKGPSNLSFGQPCTEATQCLSGICLFAGPDAEEGACAQACEDGTDCPESWSCTGLTQKGELVCQEGPATPFGF
jgi:hypothetical protein